MSEAMHWGSLAGGERIAARLREQTEDVRRLTSGLPEEQLARRVVPDQWSLKELVCHLHRVQQVFEARIDAMLREDTPEIEPYEPDEDSDFEKMAARPGVAALSSFLNDREKFVRRLEGLAPEDWLRAGVHPEFPDFGIRFQAEYMAHHEAHHIYQIFQRRSQLNRPAGD